MSPPRRFATVFVCQGGSIEFQSLLLAASLHRHGKLPGEVIAIVPGSQLDLQEPMDETLSLLEDLGVRVTQFENPIVARRRKPPLQDLLTNKIHSLTVATQASKIVFMDSDSFLHHDMVDDGRYAIPLNLQRIGGVGAQAMDKHWCALFDHFSVAPPQLWLHVSGPEKAVQIPPFFNTSFFAVPTENALAFHATWTETYLEIDRVGLISPSYQQEQAAFAITVARLGLPYELCENDLRRFRFHYSMYLHERPRELALAREVLHHYPRVRALLKRCDHWNALLDAGDAR